MGDHYPSNPEWEVFSATINLACLLIFTVEVIIKLGGFGFWGFLQDRWQRLDLVVLLVRTNYKSRSDRLVDD
jgi:hypothetical protein|eukprot:COSAG02_NODE_18915_length_910_cov_1.762022_2_plen_72_part_00